MQTMKAAVLYEVNKPLVIEELEIPVLKYGQILVKILYSGVCHSQLMEIKGFRGVDKYLPHLMGHEGVGIVADIGSGVSKVSIGDKVVLGWIKGFGLEGGGTQFSTKSGNLVNAGAVTTFSEMSIVSENRVVKLNSLIPDQVAVMFGCAIPTGAGIVINELKPKNGSTIAIFGMGGVGTSALISTALFSFSRIIAVDVEEDKLQLAHKLGATDLINSSKVDPVAVIKDITHGYGVDYAVEATGLANIVETAFASIKLRSGELIFASHPRFGDKISLDPFELICGKRIKGSWGGSCNPDVDLPKFFDLYLTGGLPLAELLSEPYRLDQINDALGALENRKLVRALIKIAE